jgi:hypothetical protein
MLRHRIRLGPPWVVATADGRTRHARKFGRPRTLDAAERVWLTVTFVPGPTDVFVNGERVGSAEAGQPFAADITGLLNPRNEVVLAAASADPPGEVALEIRSPPSAPARIGLGAGENRSQNCVGWRDRATET